MIQIENLSFAYSKKRPNVINNLSLTIEEGRIYGLLGRNGVGKSTLLHLITGLLYPREGSILIDGIEPRKRKAETLASMFFVPDEFELPAMTINEYVAIYAPFYPTFSRDVLEACLSDFELTADTRLTDASLGQKKKAFISFAIATQTSLLIMDEPTNGLDIPSKSKFRKILMRHLSDAQTVIISTHQIHDVETLFDHVLILNESGDLFSRSVGDICDDYIFEERSSADDADVIYSEPSLQGAAVMAHNSGDNATTLNLELLFNAFCKGTLSNAENKTKE